MNLLDFTKSPILNLFRKQLPKQASRSYGGAEIGRLTNDWASATGASVDSEVRSGYRILRNRARELVRNDDYVRGAKQKITDKVIGKGFTMQSQIKIGDRMDEKRNTMIEKKFKEWSKACNCDVSGILSLDQMARTAFSSMFESGDVLIKLNRQKFGDSSIPLGLEIIEADQLADDYSTMIGNNGNQIRMGVEIDKWKRPVAYWIRPIHPGDYSFNYTSGNIAEPMRVPAKDIIHLFKTERPKQVRGITWLYSTIIRSKYISEYEKALLVRARFEACLMAFKTTPDPVVNQDDYNPNIVSEYLEPGLIKQLMPGDTITPYTPNSSASNSVQFLEHQYRGSGVGLGLPYEAFSGDYSKTNYSSGRMSELDSRRGWKILQQEFKHTFYQRIYEEWLDIGALSGAIALPNDYFLNPENYCCPKWFPPGFSTVDIEKEVGANAEAIATGQTTLTKVLADLGVDIEESLKERARELELAKSLNVDITSFMQKGNNQNGQNNQAANSVPVSYN